MLYFRDCVIEFCIFLPNFNFLIQQIRRNQALTENRQTRDCSYNQMVQLGPFEVRNPKNQHSSSELNTNRSEGIVKSSCVYLRHDTWLLAFKDAGFTRRASTYYSENIFFKTFAIRSDYKVPTSVFFNKSFRASGRSDA